MWIVFLFPLYGLAGGTSRVLEWTHSASYSNINNWEWGRLPCSTDRVIFPVDMWLDIELPEKRNVMKELVLSNEGELILPDTSELIILGEGTKDNSCQGKDIHWKLLDAGNWDDPNNWIGAGIAAPDLERVPCPTDQVLFPEKSVIKMKVDRSPTVSGVTINAQTLTGDAWRTYLFSDEAGNQFTFSDPRGEIVSTGEGCNDPAGCECQFENLNDFICRQVVCQIPNCLQPVQPLGDCCLSCGSFLLFNFSPSTSLEKVRSAVDDELKISDSNILWHVGRTMGYIQVVIRPTDDSVNVEVISRRLYSNLLSSNLGLSKKSMTSAGPSFSRSSLGSPFFTFILSFILAVSAFGFVFYYFQGGRRHFPSWLGGSRGFFSATFENISGRVEILSGPRNIPTYVASSPTGFDNPMYAHETEGVSAELLPTQDEDSGSDDTGSSTSYDRKTVTTIAIADDVTLDDVPIGKLID